MPFEDDAKEEKPSPPPAHVEEVKAAQDAAKAQKETLKAADAEVRASDDTVAWDEYPINDPDWD